MNTHESILRTRITGVAIAPLESCSMFQVIDHPGSCILPLSSGNVDPAVRYPTSDLPAESLGGHHGFRKRASRVSMA